MAIKCNKCGFDQNPNNAHFCGGCGNKLGGYGEDWRLYNAYRDTLVSKYKLSEYLRYEREAKRSAWARLGDALSDIFDDVKKWFDKQGSNIFITVGGIGCVVLFMWLIFGLPGEKKQLKVIGIMNKYGIGYGPDELKVPADYDWISRFVYGDQWMLKDTTNNKYGVAYVTDSVVRVIEPYYTNYHIGAVGSAVLDRPDNKYDIIYQGRVVNSEPYASVKMPSSWPKKDEVIAVMHASGGWDLLDAHGVPITNEKFYTIYIDNDKMIRAKTPAINGTNYTILYDHAGNKMSDKKFYRVEEFSDGVAWAYPQQQDYRNGIHSVIDHKGNILSSTKNKSYRVKPFGDGIGWWKSQDKDLWHAIDKTGKELFNIEADNVYPFSMGRAGVLKNGKLGFINTEGKTVIDYIYDYHSTPVYDKDSIVYVKLNGKIGKLDINGNFTPN